MDRVFRYMRFGGGVALGGTESSEWQGWVAQLGGRALTCLWVAGECIRGVAFLQRLWQGPAALLVMEWDVEEHGMCPEI